MPKLWEETIESHRAAVRDATLATTADLVAAHGVSSVTMSEIAKETGIGRATLYKSFPDVDSILRAWHEQQVADHLEHLAQVRDQTRGDARQRLRAVLAAYAHLSRPHDGSELVARLHRGDHVDRAEQHLRTFTAALIRDAAEEGSLRTDVPPEELALYCLHALTAAAALSSRAAVGRLVDTTLTGLNPPT